MSRAKARSPSSNIDDRSMPGAWGGGGVDVLIWRDGGQHRPLQQQHDVSGQKRRHVATGPASAVNGFAHRQLCGDLKARNEDGSAGRGVRAAAAVIITIAILGAVSEDGFDNLRARFQTKPSGTLTFGNDYSEGKRQRQKNVQVLGTDSHLYVGIIWKCHDNIFSCANRMSRMQGIQIDSWTLYRPGVIRRCSTRVDDIPPGTLWAAVQSLQGKIWYRLPQYMHSSIQSGVPAAPSSPYALTTSWNLILQNVLKTWTRVCKLKWRTPGETEAWKVETWLRYQWERGRMSCAILG